MHRLAAGTGLASAAQTRTQTDDGTCDSLEELGGAGRQLRWLATLEPAKVMEPTEEDDADDVDHEVDESSKSCDDEDPDAPDAVDDAGEETQLTRPS